VTPTVYADLGDLLAAPPLDLGTTDWIEVTQADVTAFASATGGPAQVVEPYMALSLTNRFLPELLDVPAATSGVNYGADSVRFGPPPPAGARLRAKAVIVAAAEVPGGVQTTVEITVEAEGGIPAEPACVVRSLSRWMR
jgi:acyl dehydratase